MRRLLLPLVALAAAPAARADDPPARSPELKVLDRYVGSWDETLTHKPSEWMPQAATQTSVTKRAWAVGNKVMRMDGTWEPAKVEFLSLITYDEKTKGYRQWYFDASGGQPRGEARGTYNPSTDTITWTGTDDDGNTVAGTTTFKDKDTHEWTYKITDKAGKVLLDMAG